LLNSKGHMKALVSISLTATMFFSATTLAYCKEIFNPDDYLVKVNVDLVTILPEYFPEQVSISAIGSGVIFGDYIITNNHVVQGNTKLTFSDTKGNAIQAKYFASSSCDDIAIYKILPKQSSSKARVKFTNNISAGDRVTSHGFTLEAGVKEQVTLTVAKTFTNVLENNVIDLDGYLKQGYSGGPAFENDKLVGINFANNQIRNKSYIIPMYKVERIIADSELRNNIFQGGISGIFVKERKLGLFGTIVSGIIPGSPASKTDLKLGDVITEYRGVPITPNKTICTNTSNTNSISIKGFKSNTTTPFSYTIIK
jgi:serine protease Do